MRRTLLLQLGALGLIGCASALAIPRQRFEGLWEWGFETSAFTPVGRDERWWLSAERDAWRALTAPIERTGRGPWGRVVVVVEGELSVEGRYGHLGAYSRELRVTQVVSAQISPGEFPSSGS